MKIVRVWSRIIAAELLCFFINMTLAGSRSTAIRAVCFICTALILAVVLADMSVKAAHDDIKQGKTGIFAAGAAASLPFLISWGVLCVSAKVGGFDYYRWHKLINEPFLQFYNLVEPDVSVKALTFGKLMLMLAPTALPFAAVVVPYIVVRKRAEKTGG